MIYLLAKYTLLFALAALLGFVLGYWFSRRNIEDVTESFEDLRKANDRSDATQWDRLWAHLDSMPAPKETDLTPVTRNLGALEQRVNSLSRPEKVDLEPIDRRLTAIETELAGLGKRLQERQERRPVEPVSRNEPRILKAALYGTKDNLQSISGIGPKLENVLNQNGVFYFWQVAEWTKQEIDMIDERLDVFKGRIERDGWVSQAGQLKDQPGAARMPTES